MLANSLDRTTLALAHAVQQELRSRDREVQALKEELDFEKTLRLAAEDRIVKLEGGSGTLPTSPFPLSPDTESALQVNHIMNYSVNCSIHPSKKSRPNGDRVS